MLSEKIDYASSKLTCNNELALLVRVAVVSPLPKNRQIFRGPEYSPGSYLLNSRTIISSKTILNPPKKQRITNRTKHSGSSLSKRLLDIGYRLSAWNLGSCQYIKYGRNEIVHICFLLLSILFFPFYFPLSIFFTPHCQSLACIFFYKNSLHRTTKKDTSWYVTPPATKRCYARRSTTPRRNWLATMNSLCSLGLPSFLLSPKIGRF